MCKTTTGSHTPKNPLSHLNEDPTRNRIRAYCQQEFLDQRKDICVDDLDAMQASILLSLVESCGCHLSQGQIILQTIGSSGTPFTPSNVLSDELIQIALESNLISPSPNSPEQAFDLSGSAIGHNSFQMEWVAHTNDLKELRRGIFDAIENEQWAFNQDEKFVSLIQRISIAEAYEHLSLFLSIRKLPPPEYMSTKSMVQELLATYSLGRCAYIFWLSAVKAVDLRARSDISAQHASNSVIQSCREIAKKGKNNQIKIWTFDRNQYLQRSMISVVTDEIMLGAADHPFRERIPFKKNEVIEIGRNDVEPRKLSLV